MMQVMRVQSFAGAGARAALLVVVLVALGLCSGVLQQQSPEVAATDPAKDPLLAQICSNNAKTAVPIFTSPSQVRQLIDRALASMSDAGCDAKYLGAFSELKLVLADEVLVDICSPLAYERIRSYHAKFIHYYLPELTSDELVRLKSERSNGGKKSTGTGSEVDQQRAIPEALRRFFIMFVKQINFSCKVHLVERIKRMQSSGNDKALLNSYDYDQIARYKAESRRLDGSVAGDFSAKLGLSAFNVGQTDQFNKLEILDLDRAGGGMDDDDGAKLYIKVRFDDPLKRIQSACKLRFMPIYMELFAPVIKLNNLGYTDRALSRSEDKEIEKRESIQRWFDIIQACEVLKDIEVLHDSTAHNAIAGIIQAQSNLIAQSRKAQIDMKQIQLLSRKEADELRARVKQSTEVIKSSYEPDLVNIDHEQVRFLPRMLVQDEGDIRRELGKFEADLSDAIWQRTSGLLKFKNAIAVQLKRAFYRNKVGAREQDETVALGKLTAFISRHRVVIQTGAMCVSVTMLSLALTGTITIG